MTMKLKDEIIIAFSTAFMVILTFTIIVVLTYLFSILIDIILMFGR
jgi:hypothetical protein